MSDRPESGSIQPTGPSPAKRFSRSRDDRMIAGVCGGLARYFGVDPVLVRVAFVVLTIAGGSGLLAYLILWIVVPEESKREAAAPRARTATVSPNLLPVLFGAVLVAVGTILLIGQVVPWLHRIIWPTVLILIGVVVLLQGSRR